jgi:diguanylate cyclase (GGDEF)-like protein
VSAPTIDLERPVELAPRVWWVGSILPGDNFQCHVYLIEQGDQSVLIDPGSALNAELVIAKIDEVVGVENLRWLVCSHADPDILGGLPALSARGLHPEAHIVTHWRDQALIVHQGTRLPFWRVEEHDWALPLEDRTLRFIFSPYLHFAGAFGTFDQSTGTLFSGDLFGGFTPEPDLYAKDLSYFDAIRAFHEHYMPDREIMSHTLGHLKELPLRLIAPQHGQVLREELIVPMIERLESLECGVYLLARDDPGLRFLLAANQTIHDVVDSLVHEPEFSEVVRLLDGLAQRTLGADSFELWAFAGDLILHFERSDDYAGHEATLPVEIDQVVHGEPVSEGTSLVWALASLGGDRAIGAAVLRFTQSHRLSAASRSLLAEITGLVEVRLEREMLRRQAESERARWHDRAMHDPLTGVLNRSALEGALTRSLARDDHESGSGIAVLMVDIDRFKAINDTFGHLIGDEILARVASAIQASVRPTDLVFRYGGEEFLVLVPGVRAAGAEASAERVRTMVSAPSSELPPVSVSVGVALRRAGESADDLVARADAALYAAKLSGRDRVEVAP